MCESWGPSFFTVRPVYCTCSGVEMEPGRAVEELWEKASERFPTSMTALIRSFDDDLNKAKRIVRQALTGKHTVDDIVDAQSCEAFRNRL